MTDWRRPSSAEQTLIYSMFETVDSFGENCSYRIEDVNEDQFEKVIKILIDNFIENDPMMSSKRVNEDSLAMEELIEYWRKILNQKVSIVCTKEGSCDIVGVNLLGVLSEQEFDNFKPKSESLSEISKVKRFIKDIFFNPFENYHVDKLMMEEAIYIDRNYENQVIEKELIKARVTLGKVFGISTFSSFVATSHMQNILSELNYEENFSMEFKKLPKYLCEGFFPGINENVIKIMSAKFYQ